MLAASRRPQSPPRVPAIAARRVLWRHSLFARLFILLVAGAVLQVAVTSILIIAVYQAPLSMYVPPEAAGELRAAVLGQLLLVELFVVVAAGLAAYLLSRSISAPIRQLIAAMGKVAAGDLTVRVPGKRQDELGLLTTFFNVMVKRRQTTAQRNQHISALKSRFVSVTAHQLRTPLTSMKWSLQLLLEGKVGELTPEQRQIVEQERQINDQMVRLINELLNVARIEEGRFATDFQLVDLVPLAQGVMKDFAVQAEVKNIALNFLNEGYKEIRLTADPEHIKIILTNLLDNAIRYSRPGNAVAVTLSATRDRATVRVRDWGIGIPATEQDKVFARFYRASNAMKVQTDGSGLGLFIARSIARQHGGDVRFESTEGEGTTFFFTLPIQRATAAAEQSLENFMTEL